MNTNIWLDEKMSKLTVSEIKALKRLVQLPEFEILVKKILLPNIEDLKSNSIDLAPTGNARLDEYLRGANHGRKEEDIYIASLSEKLEDAYNVKKVEAED